MGACLAFEGKLEDGEQVKVVELPVVETMASVISWAIFGPSVQWGRDARTPSADEMTNQVMLVITEGLTHLAPGFLPA